MKTNLEFVAGRWAVNVGIADHYVGRAEDDDSIFDTCDAYRTLDGSIFVYSRYSKSIIKEHAPILFFDGSFHNRGKKRGKHSRSRNKEAQRWAKELAAINNLPF